VIVCELEQLSATKNERLRAWLGAEEAKILLSVVDAQVKRFACQGLNSALSAHEGNLKLESCNADLRRAQVYANFLIVMEELTSRREPFEIAKLH
jgi:hypothetical protein